MKIFQWKLLIPIAIEINGIVLFTSNKISLALRNQRHKDFRISIQPNRSQRLFHAAHIVVFVHNTDLAVAINL